MSNSEFVICQECGRKMKSITGRHLKSHNITMEEYKKKYPNAKTYIQRFKIVECQVCGKEAKFDINMPTTKAICDECRSKGHKIKVSAETVEKRKQTCLNKYGVSNPSQVESIKKKKEETNLNKSGGKYKNPLQNPEIKAKVKNTFLEKTNGKYSNWMQDPKNQKEWKDKFKEKHGVESALQIKELSDRMVKTQIERYGGIGFSSNEVKEKIDNTMIEKYGSNKVSNIPEIKEKQVNGIKKSWKENKNEINKKREESSLKHYNTNHPMQSQEVRDKVERTAMGNYGVKCTLRNPEVGEKVKKTNLEKFGNEYAIKSKEVQDKIKESRNKNSINRIKLILDYLDLELIGEYKNNHTNCKWKCKKCGTVFDQYWNYIQQGLCKCPTCYPIINNGTSKGEKEILDFIKEILPNEKVISNDRTIIKPKELDIYIPSKKIAIEYNGLYWHSEETRCDAKYHIEKTNNCLNKNIQLIHIFEDEWAFKKDIVKARLKQILGVNNSLRIHGRQCIIKEINPKEKNNFLEEFHIQGKDSSNIKLGAFYNNELVSLMTFSHGNIAKGSKSKEGIWELNRFCSNSNYHIPGIAGKLLSHFKKNYEWDEIFSFADVRWSNGNLYYKLGFELKHIAKPSYWYIKDFQRIHRFNLRKRPDEPKDITEWALRSKEGYNRIWDCGNLKFVMKK